MGKRFVNFIVGCFLVVATIAQSAAAENTIAVNISEWRAVGGFDDPTNSGQTFELPVGTQILGFSWGGLTFTAGGFNWLSDLVFSVTELSSTTSTSGFLDWSPATLDIPGTFGPTSGTWGGLQGQPGPFSAGSPFVVGEYGIYFSVYSSFVTLDPLVIHAGTIYIQTAPIPEASTKALFVGGLIFLVFLIRSARPIRN